MPRRVALIREVEEHTEEQGVGKPSHPNTGKMEEDSEGWWY